MGLNILAWTVKPGAAPVPLEGSAPALEAHLEDWIVHDISLVDDCLLLLGHQIPTEFGTLDVLALDSSGDLVVIELKKERTPREIVAQALEYAAWAADLTFTRIEELGASRYGSVEAFQQAFTERMGNDFPDTLNQGLRMILVAPEVSDRVAKVVEFLSGRLSVPINAVTFSLYDLVLQRQLRGR